MVDLENRLIAPTYDKEKISLAAFDKPSDRNVLESISGFPEDGERKVKVDPKKPDPRIVRNIHPFLYYNEMAITPIPYGRVCVYCLMLRIVQCACINMIPTIIVDDHCLYIILC